MLVAFEKGDTNPSYLKGYLNFILEVMDVFAGITSNAIISLMLAN